MAEHNFVVHAKPTITLPECTSCSEMKLFCDIHFFSKIVLFTKDFERDLLVDPRNKNISDMGHTVVYHDKILTCWSVHPQKESISFSRPCFPTKKGITDEFIFYFVMYVTSIFKKTFTISLQVSFQIILYLEIKPSIL